MSESIFRQPLKALKKFTKPRVSFGTLNQMVDSVNQMRGVTPPYQKRPQGGGGGTIVSGVSAPDVGQEFRVLPPNWYDSGEKDIIRAVMYWPETQWTEGDPAEGTQPWRIQLPWILRRTPFEHIAGQEDAFRGTYYVYDTWSEGNYARNAQDAATNPQEVEAQRIVPMWSGTTDRPHQDIITASKVSVNVDGITRKRTGVAFQPLQHVGDYLRGTLFVNSGEGDVVPPVELNAVFGFRAVDGGPTKYGQLYRWTSTNPLMYVSYDETLNVLAGQTVNLNMSWSWRWQMWPDRNWAVRYGT
jgi:hypothetical protein